MPCCRSALLLSELLRPYGFDYALARTVAAALGGASGTRFETATHRLVLDRGQLVITPKDLRPFGSYELTATTTELKLPGGRVVRIRSTAASADYMIPRKPNVAALDAVKLTFPLTIRAWAPGDWLVPLGMRGKQKVSDLLINLKVPTNLKDRVLVLVNANGSLVWVIGHRLDDRFKVTPDTTDVVEIGVA
jgi:tRNA(Ile)-lysidine synthase